MPGPRHLLLAASLAAALASTTAPAQHEGSGDGAVQVDSVLDRLEKRLLDQEADGLSYGEKQPPPSTGDAADGLNEGGVSKHVKVEHAEKITAKTSGDAERIKSVESLVAELENDVDQLASNVQKTRQGVLDEAAVDNFVTIEAQLADTDAAAIKTLTVKLDGYPVYELSEASGLWMPTKSVPLYAGPLQPGNHRLDLEARLVVRQGGTLPLNSDLFRFVTKSFDLTVTSGTKSSRYAVAFSPPSKLGDGGGAELKEIR